MDGRRVLWLLRTSTLVTSVVICGLLIALWVRSYWSVDILIGRFSNTTHIQIASTNGRLLLVAVPSGGTLGWSWSSITDAEIEQNPGFMQIRSEYQTLLTALESARSTTDSPRSAAALAAQINQTNVEFEIMREQVREVTVGKMWGDPNQSGPLLLGNLTQDLRIASNRWGFGVKRFPNGAAFASPHWCPVLISGAIAVACGIRRSWRFSLRMLLVAVTVVAIVLGLVVAFR